MILYPQQRKTDCGIAALATYLQVPYEDANDATLLCLGTRLGRGVYCQTLIRAAQRLGRKLRRLRRIVRLSEDMGILSLSRPGGGHFAVLLEGQVYDPDDNSLWDVDDYLAANGFVVGGLLV